MIYGDLKKQSIEIISIIIEKYRYILDFTKNKFKFLIKSDKFIKLRF